MFVFVMLLMSIIAVLAIGCAINFFFQTGFSRAFGYALFIISIFLVFWATGLWSDAHRHSWGSLTPVFALLIALGWVVVLFLRMIFKRCLQSREQDKN